MSWAKPARPRWTRRRRPCGRAWETACTRRRGGPWRRWKRRRARPRPPGPPPRRRPPLLRRPRPAPAWPFGARRGAALAVGVRPWRHQRGRRRAWRGGRAGGGCGTRPGFGGRHPHLLRELLAHRQRRRVHLLEERFGASVGPTDRPARLVSFALLVREHGVDRDLPIVRHVHRHAMARVVHALQRANAGPGEQISERLGRSHRVRGGGLGRARGRREGSGTEGGRGGAPTSCTSWMSFKRVDRVP